MKELKKESFEHHHYIYLKKKRGDKEPKSPSFDTIAWELVADTFDNWLNKAMKKDDREYPIQTMLQVDMFIRSIRRSICDLDEKTRRDLAELYIEYFEEISDIKS